MTRSVKSPGLMVFANRNGVANEIRRWAGSQFAGKPYCIVCVSNNASPTDPTFAFPAKPDALTITRALVLFEGAEPIDLENVARWRGWVIDRGAWESQMDFFRGWAEEQQFREILSRKCAAWSVPLCAEEPIVITVGQLVRVPNRPTAKDDPSLLTMMFGSMGDLMTQVELVARRFKVACRELKPATIRAYLTAIDEFLCGDQIPYEDKEPELGLEKLTDHLPRLLLRGETGVGKTLIARYLHRKCGFGGRPLRIPIPEYLDKEDMFEYDLFGHMQGAYTDAKDAKHGLLLENVGGVVFLDEIGEANEILQAKLLAFLDDYRVRPRKWEGTPFYCPVLLVAATNRDLNQMAKEGLFRRDLLARFTDRHRIPSLMERRDELPFILDCLLQRESINPGGIIRGIGQGAFDHVMKQRFDEGNFRELEDLFRAACQLALREDRHYLCKADVVRDTLDAVTGKGT